MTDREMLDLLASDEVQQQLKPGFQKDFGSGSVLNQNVLTPRQREIVQDILERYAPGHKPSKFMSRRYEGYEGGKR